MCYGDDYSEGARQLATVTGPPPLMPFAAYGVWYVAHMMMAELWCSREQTLQLPYMNVLVLGTATLWRAVLPTTAQLS